MKTGAGACASSCGSRHRPKAQGPTLPCELQNRDKKREAALAMPRLLPGVCPRSGLVRLDAREAKRLLAKLLPNRPGFISACELSGVGLGEYILAPLLVLVANQVHQVTRGVH